MKRLLALWGTVAVLAVPLAQAAAPKTEKEKLSYTVGFQIAAGLKRDGMDLDVKAINQAIKDVLGGKKPQMTPDQMRATMQAFQKKKRDDYMALAKKNESAGEAFLAKNKKKAGVVELPSGLQYMVIKQGSGKKPKATDTVVANYRGTLVNGTEFDSSYTRGKPATFSLNGVIAGWREALQLMPEGAKWKVFIPSKLAYGMRGAGGGKIGPNETLVFDIELVSIKEAGAAEAPAAAPAPAASSESSDDE